MAVAVVRVRILSGVNFDMESDSFATLQLDQQTATTRIAFGGTHQWNQSFTFIVTSSSRRKLIIEGYEHEYMDNTFLGTCVVPHLNEYAQEEEITADLQRGGVKTKKALKLSISYRSLYSHDVEWQFDTSNQSDASAVAAKSNLPQTPTMNRRLLIRRHSVEHAPPYDPLGTSLFGSEPNVRATTQRTGAVDPSAGSIVIKHSKSQTSTMEPSSSRSSLSSKTTSHSLTSLPDVDLSNIRALSPTSDFAELGEHSNGDAANRSLSSTGFRAGSESILHTESQSKHPKSSNLALQPSSSLQFLPGDYSSDIATKTSSSHNTSMDADYDETDDEEDECEDVTAEGIVVFRDHFGFPIESTHIEAYLSMFEYQFSTRMKEQASYLSQNLNRLLSVSPTRPIVSRELVGFAKSGFPLSHRGELWQSLSGSKDAMRRHKGLYHSLLERNEGVETAATTQIEKDLHRTFISNPLLRTKSDIARLQRVLNAFSFYDPQTGYCQSLNFIAALYLLLMSEEEAFWLLIVTTKKYLPEYYSPDMVGSKTDAHIFEALLYTYFPMIAHQLFDLGLPVVLRTASWFLCMFVTILPIETTMRVFDWMFSEGSQVIFSVGLALFHLSSTDLSTADSFDSAYFTFTTMTQHCYNADHLVELAATKFHLVRKEIALLRNKLRLEYSRRDEQELISSLNLSPDDFYTLVTQIETIASSARNTTTSLPGSAVASPLARSRNSLTSSVVRSSSGSLADSRSNIHAESEAGVLGKKEFVAVFTKIFPNLDPSVPESVFDTLDSDEDAGLTIKECLLGISAFVVGAPEKKAMMWFRVFDKNNDGILSVSEIRDLLTLVWKLIDKQLDSSWIDEFLKVVETTHSGRITKHEFASACLDMPILSEWLKFGFTLGDRVKVMAAKEEAADKVETMRLSGNFTGSLSTKPSIPAPSASIPVATSSKFRRSRGKTVDFLEPEDLNDAPRRAKDSDDEDLPHHSLSSSPPHTWFDREGKLNPRILENALTTPPPSLSHELDDHLHSDEEHRRQPSADLSESAFYMV